MRPAGRRHTTAPSVRHSVTGLIPISACPMEILAFARRPRICQPASLFHVQFAAELNRRRDRPDIALAVIIAVDGILLNARA
jgi:hypothetical protein